MSQSIDDVAATSAHGGTVPAPLIEATRRIGAIMSSGDEPATVIAQMLGVVRAACGGDAATVSRIRDGSLTFVHAAADGDDELRGRSMALEGTICRTTWGRSGTLVLGPEAPELAADPERGRPAYGGYAGRTLVVDGRPWGTVAVWSSGPLAVSADEATLLIEMLAAAVVAQLARIRSRMIFREVESTAGIGAWAYSLGSGTLWWSDEVFRIHGLEPGAAMPTVEHAIDAYHPEDRGTIRMLLEYCIMAGEPWDTRLRLITATGETRWVRARGQRIDDAGVPARIFGTFEDVHEQVIAELERDQMRARLEHAIHGTNDGLWDWPDMDRDDQWWSPRFLQLLGLAAGELAPRYSNLIERIHPDERAEVVAAIAASRELETPFESEFRLRTADGSHRWFLGRARVSSGGTGRRARMAGSIQDIDERRRMESLLRDRTRESEAFLHAASHDLKSPMLTIDAFSERIEANAATGTRAELVHDAGHVRAAATRVQAIVRDLLAFARTGRTEPEMVPVAIPAMVGELRHQLAGAIDRRSVRIETEATLPTVLADRGQMASLLQNLLTNALAYGLDEEGRGRIVVGTEVAPESRGLVRLFVRDAGAGVREVDREGIFLPFERRRVATGGQGAIGGGGTGLGLAIVRRIAEVWGGRVWVEPAEGGGARFVVEWPGLVDAAAGRSD
jgi:PAS domain S-box-containing protein